MNNKKTNFKLNNNKKFKDLFKFYNKNIRKIHLICFIVSLIFFVIFFTYIMNNKTEFIDIIKYNKMNRFTNAFTQKLPLIWLLVFSGMVSFVYIPLIGIIGLPYTIVLNLCNYNIGNIVFSSIFLIFELFFSNLAVATGMYLCKESTKKFKYNQRASFTYADVKQRFLELTKSEKLKEYKLKRLRKQKEIEKLNVKIDYKNIIKLTLISSIFVVIFTLISGV